MSIGLGLDTRRNVGRGGARKNSFIHHAQNKAVAKVQEGKQKSLDSALRAMQPTSRAP
jgi:hypothetical protein